MARERVNKAEKEVAAQVVVEEVVAPQKPNFRVISGGITLLDKRYFKKGDVFYADVKDIPVAFRDLLQPLESPAAPAKPRPVFTKREVVPTAEELEAEDFVQMYEIVNAAGKAIGVPMAEGAANEMLKALNA